MKKIYVAHPYHGEEGKKQKVEALIRDLVKKYPDVLYVSPIHALGFLYNDVDYDQGMQYCFGLLETCDELLLCEGWENSKGCNLEKEFADDHGIAINYVHTYIS